MYYLRLVNRICLSVPPTRRIVVVSFFMLQIMTDPVAHPRATKISVLGLMNIIPIHVLLIIFISLSRIRHRRM